MIDYLSFFSKLQNQAVVPLLGLIVFVGCTDERLTPDMPIKHNADLLAGSCSRFKKSTGRFPNNFGELVKKPSDLPNNKWNGPYIDPDFEEPTDIWGNPFAIEVLDGIGRVVSAGEDGLLGTPDDIKSDAI